MNFPTTIFNKLKHLFIISFISVYILSCGGGGGSFSSAGISGTGISVGEVTGFGSIFVNGVEYETDNASFNVDGNLSATQDQLKIGMVVKLETTSFDDGTFEANTVFYDDSIEGPILTTPVTPVSGNTDLLEFTVLADKVVVSETTTTFDNSSFNDFSFTTLAQNDVIEVSGFLDASGTIKATLVEKKGVFSPSSTNTPVEVHGQVSDLIENTLFKLGATGITINFNASTQLDDLDNGLAEGLIVEVEGLYDSTNNSINATKIEGEDDDVIGSGSGSTSLSLQGLIVGIDVTQTLFSINGIPVEVDDTLVPASIISQLVEGLNVEVEGILENGVLMADRVEIREGRSQYRAVVRSVNLSAKTVNIGYPGVSGEIQLQLDAQSILQDDDNGPLALSALNVNDEVRVEARALEGEKIVVSLKQRSISSYKITGNVQAVEPNGSIRIDDLVFPLDNNVFIDPLLPDPIEPGTAIELEDEDKDGDIDEVSPDSFS